MINEENPDYQYCVDNKFLLRDSRGAVRPISWWHGSGGLLDYSNPAAADWWHRQMDRVLDIGVDGFKCDGTDPYVLEYSLTGGALGFNDQVISYRDYADLYYRDSLYYTRQKRGGDNGLIMSRPVDCFVDSVTKACLDYSPKDVMFSGWVGDDDATFNGLQGCARKSIYSAWEGYASFGCDIGGYRGKEKNRELFIRWAQFGALSPLMENGGGGEHRPWMYDDETVDIYRTFVQLHHQLSTYFHLIGAEAIETGVSTITPLSKKASSSPLTPPSDTYAALANVSAVTSQRFLRAEADRRGWFPEPETFSYLIGKDILVHPVLHEANITDSTDAGRTLTTVANAVFPAIDGQPTDWLNWFHPTDAKAIHRVMTTTRTHVTVPLDSYPVYVRRDAFLCLESTRDAPRSAGGKPVFTWFGPSAQNTVDAPKIAVMRESASTGPGMSAVGYYTDDTTLEVKLSARSGPVALELVGVMAPASVTFDHDERSLCESAYDRIKTTLLVSCSDNSLGTVISISNTTNVYSN